MYSWTPKKGKGMKEHALSTVFSPFLAIWVCLLVSSDASTTCSSVSVQDRIPCGDPDTTRQQCLKRGCCHDDQFYNMCYFSKDCKKVMTAAGTSSVMMLVPGEEVKGHEGSPAMLEGGHWCQRQADTLDTSLTVHVDLHGVKTVYMSTSSQVEVQPFYITYSYNREYWTLVDLPAKNSSAWSVNGQFMSSFNASELRIRPQPHVNKPCVSLEFVICPADLLPPRKRPRPPEEQTTESPDEPPVSTEAPRPVVRASMPSPDSMPVAITIGTMWIAILLGLLSLFIFMDIPTYKQHFGFMRKNIRSYIAYRRAQKTHAAESVPLKGQSWNLKRETSSDKTKDKTKKVPEVLL